MCFDRVCYIKHTVFKLRFFLDFNYFISIGVFNNFFFIPRLFKDISRARRYRLKSRAGQNHNSEVRFPFRVSRNIVLFGVGTVHA